MKKLILAFCGLALSLFASAQFNRTFVYDDGTIQTGYFGVGPGQGGIYWSQGAFPTPYSIDSSQRTSGVVAAVSMNSSLVTIPGRQCGQTSTVTSISTCSSAFKPNVAPGLFAPFVLTFGINTVTGKSFSVDISSQPVLVLKYKKPSTPASDYYAVAYTDGASSNPTSNPANMKINQFSPTVTFSGTANQGSIVGNISSGIAASSPPNINYSPLRVTIQVTDINKNKLELMSTTTTNYTTGKLGFTLPTSATDSTVTLNLNNLFVLDTVTSPCYPGNAFICKNPGFGSLGCPAVRFPLANSTTSGSPFDYKNVTQVLIYLSGACGGQLSVATTLGICGYGVNYTCYDNTLTITGFSLGKLPNSGGYPGYLTVRTVSGSSSFNINWLNSKAIPDSIAVARSTSSTGGWVVVRYVDAQTIGTVPGFTTIDTASAYYATNTFYDGTVGGASFYKIGGVNKGLITWSPGFATVGVKDLTPPLNANTVTGISFVQEYLGESNVVLAPNPTSGNTSLKYNLVKSANISVKVFNSLSQEVYSTPETYLAPGSYSDDINLYGKNQGLYFVVILVNGKPVKVEKLLLD